MFKVSFFLELQGENFNPDELKEIINRENIRIQRIGEKSRSGRKSKTNSLCLYSVPEELDDFSDHLYRFVQEFIDKIEKIKAYALQHDLQILLRAEIRSWVDANPGILINAITMNALADLGCKIIIKLKGIT